MKKINLPLWLTLFLTMASSSYLMAQEQLHKNHRFNAGIIAGLNFAELEGEGVSSYFGVNAGFLGTAKLAQKWELGLELLYSRDGEYSLPDFYPRIDYGRINLNYFEIPVYISFLAKDKPNREFYNWKVNLGAAYTRLLSYYVESSTGIDMSEEIIWSDKNAILIQGGATYFPNSHLGLNFRGTLSTDAPQLGWTLSIRLIYMIL